MGREFELKYICTEEAFAALQADFADFTSIQMETTYYDTVDGRLGNNHWTLRRRYENGTSICTLKTPCPDGGRGEWEVEAAGIMAAIPQLVRLGAPMDLMAFCVSGVAPVCGAKFTRLARKLEIPGALVELALDRGILTGGSGELPLLEVEVELKEGSDNAVTAFALELAAKYGLKPQKHSKFRRALGLARGEYHV